MEIRCPTCGCVLPMDDVNVARDLALCRACEQTFRFADLVDGARRPMAGSATPPPGTWFEETFDGFIVGATTRSPTAFFIVPFMLFWSGFALSGIYGTQIVARRFNPFMAIFGIPFLLGSIFLGWAALLTVCGRVVVTVAGDLGQVFTGIGPLGIRRRFSWAGVHTIEETFGTVSNRGRTSRVIRLASDRLVSFGSMLNDERRYYLVQTLRQLRARPVRAIKPVGSLDFD